MSITFVRRLGRSNIQVSALGLWAAGPLAGHGGMIGVNREGWVSNQSEANES
jgi:hypothetical protein